MSPAPEFHLFLPQMRMSLEAMVERARAAEAAGFTGLALMDHLAPPMAEGHDMFDAMVTASWLAAHTETLTLGHLVLCDSFRHPAVLAKQAVTLDHASGGRFELGIGWGSVAEEFHRFGIGETEPRVRVRRLRETLEVVTALWSGEPVDFEGQFHHWRRASSAPPRWPRSPSSSAGRDPAPSSSSPLMPRGGTARSTPSTASTSSGPAPVPHGPAPRRWWPSWPTPPPATRWSGWPPVGSGTWGEASSWATPTSCWPTTTTSRSRGVERIYVWFADFAAPSTLAAFGDQVIAAC